MDNEIFKNWWRDSNQKFQEFDKSKVIRTEQDFEIIDRRVEAIADLYEHLQHIYKSIEEHENRIKKLEDEKP